MWISQEHKILSQKNYSVKKIMEVCKYISAYIQTTKTLWKLHCHRSLSWTNSFSAVIKVFPQTDCFSASLSSYSSSRDSLLLEQDVAVQTPLGCLHLRQLEAVAATSTTEPAPAQERQVNHSVVVQSIEITPRWGIKGNSGIQGSTMNCKCTHIQEHTDHTRCSWNPEWAYFPSLASDLTLLLTSLSFTHSLFLWHIPHLPQEPWYHQSYLQKFAIDKSPAILAILVSVCLASLFK